MKTGYSLIETMIVIAIIATLTAIAFPTFGYLLGKAKRTEALLQLRSIYAAQKIFHLEYGRYSDKLTGPESIGWLPEGYKGDPHQENFAYTYGFAGLQGVNYVVGKLDTPASFLQGAHASFNTMRVYAVGWIKGPDHKPDIVAIDERGVVTVIQDGLQ